MDILARRQLGLADELRVGEDTVAARAGLRFEFLKLHALLRGDAHILGEHLDHLLAPRPRRAEASLGIGQEAQLDAEAILWVRDAQDRHAILVLIERAAEALGHGDHDASVFEKEDRFLAGLGVRRLATEESRGQQQQQEGFFHVGNEPRPRWHTNPVASTTARFLCRWRATSRKTVRRSRATPP